MPVNDKIDQDNRWFYLLENIRFGVESTIKSELLEDSDLTKKTNKMLQFTCDTSEKYCWGDLIKIDNSTLSKTLTTVCKFCSTIEDFIQLVTHKYIPSIQLYEDSYRNVKNYKETEMIENISKILSDLMEIASFFLACKKLINNIMLSIVSMYSESQSGVKFNSEQSILISRLGSLVFVLAELDICLMSSVALQDHYQKYRTLILGANQTSVKYDVDETKFHRFRKAYNDLELKLFNHPVISLLLNVAQETSNPSYLKQNNSKWIAQMFYNFINSNIDHYMNDQTSIGRITFRHAKDHVVYETYGLYILHSNIYNASNSKILKQLLKAGGFFCVLSYSGLIFTHPNQLLKTFTFEFGQLITKKVFDSYSTEVNSIEPSSPFINNLGHLMKELDLWCTEIEKDDVLDFPSFRNNTIDSECLEQKKPSDAVNKLIENKVRLIITSVLLVNGFKLLLRIVAMNYTKLYSKPTPLLDKVILRLINGLLTIKQHYEQFNYKICSSVIAMRAYFASKIYNFLKSFKTTMKGDITTTQSPESTSARLVSLNVVCGPMSWQRCMIIILCMEIMFDKKRSKTPLVSTIYENLLFVQNLSSFSSFFNFHTDLSFLYFNKKMIDLYIQNTFRFASSAFFLEDFSYIIDDCVKLIQKPTFSTPKDKSEAIREFTRYIQSLLNKEIIVPICEKIEIDARLLNFNTECDTEVVKSNEGIESFLKLKPIKLYDEFCSIKHSVEDYIEKTFYNHTAISPYEWHNYEKMRRICTFVYNIHLIDNYLPVYQIEQGMDLLEVMQNMDDFITKFSYNMNDQIFIENVSSSNFLKVVNIKHVANSIRFHGVGIVNTGVNMTYQLLKKKFLEFSQFLFCEQIKARLFKEISLVAQNKSSSEIFYPFDRIDVLIRDIRSISANNPLVMCFDKFRDLICQIGNLLGFVRILRNGVLHYLNGHFEYSIDSANSNTKTADKLSSIHSEETKTSSSYYDSFTLSFDEIAARGIEYNQILIKVFHNYFQNKANESLLNFYIITPALIHTLIEQLMKRMESTTKKQNENIGFTEDGVILGISFILTVTNCHENFSSLNCIASLLNKIEQDRKYLDKQFLNKDDKLLNALRLSMSRIKFYELICHQVNHNLECSRLFFNHDINSSTTNQQTDVQTPS